MPQLTIDGIYEIGLPLIFGEADHKGRLTIFDGDIAHTTIEKNEAIDIIHHLKLQFGL